MMHKVDENLKPILFNALNEITETLITNAKRYGYTTVSFNVHRKPNSGTLTLVKKPLYLDTDSNPEIILEQWIEDMKLTEKDYVNVRIFGNGIEFSVFVDSYGVMEGLVH